MVLRIERNSISVKSTPDPNIVEVTASVTKDDITVQSPKMYSVNVLWNTTTPRTALREAMRLAIKEDTLQDDLRAALGEEILQPAASTTPAPPAPQPIIITTDSLVINAASVTVNETGTGGV